MREELLEAISQQLFEIKLKEAEIKVIKHLSASVIGSGYEGNKYSKEAEEALEALKIRYNELTIQLTENNFKI